MHCQHVADGETLVHLLLKRDNPRCTDVALILLERYPGLAQDVTLGDDSHGETALHIAVINDDVDVVFRLLTAGANVHARATGRFFQPDDQQASPPVKRTSYIGYAYYGEYPLAFSAVTGNKDIYDALLAHGADPNEKDVYGNTVLHMCVIHSNTVSAADHRDQCRCRRCTRTPCATGTSRPTRTSATTRATRR